jgi:hypothetical protein
VREERERRQALNARTKTAACTAGDLVELLDEGRERARETVLPN